MSLYRRLGGVSSPLLDLDTAERAATQGRGEAVPARASLRLLEAVRHRGGAAVTRLVG